VLSSTVASHHYNCWTDGSTSPRNYGYPLVSVIYTSCHSYCPILSFPSVLQFLPSVLHLVLIFSFITPFIILLFSHFCTLYPCLFSTLFFSWFHFDFNLVNVFLLFLHIHVVISNPCKQAGYFCGYTECQSVFICLMFLYCSTQDARFDKQTGLTYNDCSINLCMHTSIQGAAS
jgi:hypothetical protein